MLLFAYEHDPDRGPPRQGVRRTATSQRPMTRPGGRAYQGIIPGNELDKLINRRGPEWWDSAIRKGSRIAILQFGEQRRRLRQLRPQPRAQPVLRRRDLRALSATRVPGPGLRPQLVLRRAQDLVQSGLKSLVVWALSDNEPAVEFYRALGGKAVARSSERFGSQVARQGRLRLAELRHRALSTIVGCLQRKRASVCEAISARWTRRRIKLSPVPTTRGPYAVSRLCPCRPSGTLASRRRLPASPFCAHAARTVLSSRQAIVIGPTPPGTGVIAPATVGGFGEGHVADDARLAGPRPPPG